MRGQKALVGLHQHIENRITDSENVVFRLSHPQYPVAKSVEGAATYHVPPTRQQARAAMDPPMIRSILTVSTGTLASRLLGFARDSP